MRADTTYKASYMISVTYVSSAVRKFKSSELIQLLHQCRDNNERLQVTGMLLYKDGNFMQLLEGTPVNVRKVLRAINADPRHEGMVTLAEEDTEYRLFKHWPMAFCNLNTIAADVVPGYSEFANQSLLAPAFQSDPARAQQLMVILRALL